MRSRIFGAILVLEMKLTTACSHQHQPDSEALTGSSDGVMGTVESTDGLTVAYTSYGKSEPALVLIHGRSCDQSYWQGQVDAFKDRFQVVLVDLGGHGRSSKSRSEWTFEKLAEDVHAVIDHLGLRRVVLIGHSMGGPVALETAFLLPGQVLAVVGVDALHDAGMKVDPDRWKDILASYEADFKGTCNRFVQSMFLPQSDPFLQDGIRERMCQADPEIALALLRISGAFDLGETLQKVRVPVRCINASLYPTNIEGNRLFADFDATTMDGVGHFLMMERPEEFNRVLGGVLEEFLSP